MASTGNVFPTAAASVDRAGSAAWNNPTNVFSDNATSATQAVAGVADYLVTSGYGFSIPTNATIIGVTVRVEASETGSGSATYTPQLHSNTTPTLIGSAKSPVTVTTGPTISTNGSATDLWGATLTPAIVNDAGFGVSIWSVDTNNTLSIDYVTIAIEYSLPTDDGDVSWWAGTNLSGAKVAIAGGAAALAASVAIAGGFNFNDEIGTAAADLGFGGNSASIAQPQPGIRVQLWPQGDDLPVAAAPSVVFDEGVWSARPPAPQITRLVFGDVDVVPAAAATIIEIEPAWRPAEWLAPITSVLWATDDEIVPQPAAASGGGGLLHDPVRVHRWYVDEWAPQTVAAVALDDGTWQLPAPAPALPFARLWWDNDPYKSPTPDESDAQPPRPAQPEPTVRVWQHADEIGTVAAALASEPDEWQRFTPQPNAITRAVWQHQDERETAAVPLPVGDDESRPPASARLVEPSFVIWAENDDFPQQTAALRAEDEAFTPAPKQVEVNGIIWAVDDDLPRQPWVPREEYWHRVYSIRVDPVLRVWQQQDERETAATPLPVDENEWARPFSITPPRDLRLWATTDDIEQTPAALQVVDDDHWLPYTLPARPLHTLWATDEPIVPVPATLAVEDYWQAPFTMRVQPIAWVGEHQDDRETAPAPLEVDDEYWQKPPHIVPPFDLRIWSDDDPLVPYVAPVVVHGRRGSPVKGGPGRSFTYPERSSNTSKTRRK
jgi:hypothetical protein